MFFSPGLEQLDPALLAFVKCHVTSPVKWEVLRVLASQEGAWTRADQLARSSHRRPCELTQAVADSVHVPVIASDTTQRLVTSR